MRALGKIRPDVKVVGILCCAENFPDANAQRPGDIFTAKNGKSIMVDNTDAEGRLVLTDGFARAGEEGATHLVDIAGPMFRDKEWKYYEAGALGFGVKTLVDLCERFREELTA